MCPAGLNYVQSNLIGSNVAWTRYQFLIENHHIIQPSLNILGPYCIKFALFARDYFYA